MLTPEYLEKCADSVLGIYDELNVKIVEDIARRIVKTGKITNTAMWQLKQAQECGKLLEDIVQEVAAITGFSNDYIKELFHEAGVKSLAYESRFITAAGLSPITLDTSPAMLHMLAAAIEKTQGNLNNLTGTTAVTAQSRYIEAVNMAYMQVTSGAFSYEEAIRQAVRTVATEGSEVHYFSGHSSKLDVAVRRSLLTGVNQTAGKLTEMYAADIGCDYYETSAHAGARNIGSGYLNHESWQGQIFCISGKDRKYKKFEEVTGYGTGGGICGWNCRHSFHMFLPGISKPAYSRKVLEGYAKKQHSYKNASGEKVVMSEYECTQKQRAYERSIRKSKTLLAGYDAAIKEASSASLENCLKEEFTAESIKLKKLEAEMKDFCRQTNRTVNSARTQVYAVKNDSGRIVNFGKSVSQKAVWADKKSRQEVPV